MQEKSAGTVRFYDAVKGWGFIADDHGGPDVYVHCSEVARAKLVALDHGDRIAYQAVKNNAACRVDALCRCGTGLQGHGLPLDPDLHNGP
jgi:CspA family cold shock protein